MLRDFIKCTTIKERIKYVSGTYFEQWSDAELDAVMDIMGIKNECNSTVKRDKYNTILNKYSNKFNEIVMINTTNIFNNNKNNQ